MANLESQEDLLRIVTRANEIMDNIVDVFTSNGISLPEHRYIAVGPLEEVTHDFKANGDGQVTVSFAGLRLGITPNSQGMVRGCFPNYIATFNVELVRCTPQNKTTSYGKNTGPTAISSSEYAELRMKDSWLLLRAVQNVSTNHTTLHDLTTTITSGKEDGGTQAIGLTVEVLI